MGNLFEELKRRKVFRVAAVYAVVAWVLIQVADTVLPALQMPQWTVSFVTVLFILGLLPTLIAAWAYEITPDGIRSDASIQAVQQTSSSTDRKLIYATFILVLLVAGFQITDRFLFSPDIQSVPTASDNASATPASTLSRRASINIGNTLPVGGGRTNTEIALSADGSKLVYRVLRPGTEVEQLYIKYLDQLEEQELYSGQATSPFFSADGEWVGFVQSNSLYKLSIRGGAPQLIAESGRGGSGGFWSAGDTIFYTSEDLQFMRGSATGSEPEPLDVGAGVYEAMRSWPYLLPGEDALLYTLSSFENMLDGRIDLLVQSTGEVRTIIQNGYNARYVPTGHIVFVRAAALWAVPFDVNRLETTGPEQPVIQGVQTNTQRGPTIYAFSDDGLLVYLPGGDTDLGAIESALVWVDRDGNEEALPQLQNFRRTAVSPDGQRLAVSVDNGNFRADIWIYDLARDTLNRLTFDDSDDYFPLWTPDGKRIIFGSNRDGGGLWSRAADGSGVTESLLAGVSRGDPSDRAYPYAFTPDGTQLLYTTRGDIYTLTPGNEVPSQPLIQSEFSTQRPDLSPDGRWLAYGSDETGRFEVYVRPFPNVDDGKWQISSEGGQGPKWSPDNLELFFSGSNAIWVAQRQTADTSQFDTPVRAIEGSYASLGGGGTFDISADGSRILLRGNALTGFQETEVTQLVTVENWFEELKRLAPPDPQ